MIITIATLLIVSEKIKPMVGNDVIATAIGAIVAILVSSFFEAVLMVLKIVEIPKQAEDPFFNDPKWRNGYYNSAAEKK